MLIKDELVTIYKFSEEPSMFCLFGLLCKMLMVHAEQRVDIFKRCATRKEVHEIITKAKYLLKSMSHILNTPTTLDIPL
jgi:hypothetical protein